MLTARHLYINKLRILKFNCLLPCVVPGGSFGQETQSFTSTRRLSGLLQPNPTCNKRYHASVATAGLEDERKQLNALFPDIVRDLTEMYQHNMPEVAQWHAKLLEYNVNAGRMRMNQAIMQCYRLLASPHDLTPDKLLDVQRMAWCSRVFAGTWVLLDDPLDGSLTRWGRPCWHRRPEVGAFAINDVMFLLYASFKLLRKYFYDKTYYHQVLNCFNYMNQMVIKGQNLDFLIKNQFQEFTMETYKTMVEYKCMPFLCMPVALPIYMVGITDEEIHRQVRQLLFEIFLFFQMENDYTDCFGEESAGKVGNDVQEGKCTWLVVTALQRASAEQKTVLEECYGSSDPDKVRAIKDVYLQVDLPDIYRQQKQFSYDLSTANIEELPPQLNKGCFRYFLDMVHKTTT